MKIYLIFLNYIGRYNYNFYIKKIQNPVYNVILLTNVIIGNFVHFLVNINYFK